MFYFQQMKQQYLEYRLQFFTATIQEWTQLLKEYKHKNVIVDSFKFIVMEGNVTINGFVPIAIGMPNHLHITCLPFRFAFRITDYIITITFSFFGSFFLLLFTILC